MNLDLKLVSGIFFFGIDLAVFLIGSLLLWIGVNLISSDGSQGTISLIVKEVGEITGINGSVVVLLVGFCLVCLAVSYALKAYQAALEAAANELPDMIKHFSPL